MTEQERWLQSVLNNIVYYLNEPPDYDQNQTDYALPDSEDIVSRVESDDEKSQSSMLSLFSGVAVLGGGNTSRLLHSEA